MTPFYERDGIVIYCGDCLEILPGLSGIDALITDPPYGINYRQGGGAGKKPKWVKRHINTPIIGDSKPFNPAHLLSYPRICLFGANYYADKLPASRGWVTWDKKPDLGSNDLGDGELIWTNQDKVLRCFRHRWSGVIRDSENGEIVLHPTQKPVALMKWLILYLDTPKGGLICDPYAGSGSTLVAAKELGYGAIGIEIVEDYCRVIVDRLRQPSFFSLPQVKPIVKATQETLL